MIVLQNGLKALAETIVEPEELSAGEPMTLTSVATTTVEIAPTVSLTATSPFTTYAPLVSSDTEDNGLLVDISSLRSFPALVEITLPQPGKGHLFGLVWDDLNSNSTPDDGEIPIPDAIITLFDNEGVVMAKAITTADGRYFFPNLEPGAYTLEEIGPENAGTTRPNSVTIAITENGVIEVNFVDASE